MGDIFSEFNSAFGFDLDVRNQSEGSPEEDDGFGDMSFGPLFSPVPIAPNSNGKWDFS